MKLFPHQRGALRAVTKAMKQGICRQLVVMPTGGGKTVTFSHVIKKRGGRALVLAHRDELLTQAADTLRRIMPRASVGILRDGDSGSDYQIVVASVQRLSRPRWLDSLENDFRTIVVDEAHHVPANSYQRIINHYSENSPLVLGVTATPVRENNRPIEGFEIVHQTSIADGVHEGWLSDVEGKLIHLKDADFSKIHLKNGDLNLSELEAILRASNWHEYVSRAYFEHAREKKTIIFVPRVSMAHELAIYMREQGAKAEAVDGEMNIEKRRDVIQRLAANQLEVVINCAVLTEGFDDPSLSCVIMARPTRSWSLYVQCIGRGLRFQEGKTCLVLDMVGGTMRHDLVTLPKLAGVDDLADGELLSRAIVRGEQEAVERVRLEAEMEAKRVELVQAKEAEKANRPNCRHCGSSRTTPGATSKTTGRRRIQCLDCRKSQTEGYEPPDRSSYPPCIDCGSLNVTNRSKGWFYCKECKKGYSPNVSYRADRSLSPDCPSCSSKHVKKLGFRHAIRGDIKIRLHRRFKCLNCAHKWTDGLGKKKPNPKPTDWSLRPCPFCQSSDINVRSNSMLFCKTCRRIFHESRTPRRLLSANYPPCAHCNSKKMVKSGKSKKGQQVYICRECNRRSTFD